MQTLSLCLNLLQEFWRDSFDGCPIIKSWVWVCQKILNEKLIKLEGGKECCFAEHKWYCDYKKRIFVPVPCVKVLNSLEFPEREALKYLLLFNNCLSTTLEFILMRWLLEHFLSKHCKEIEENNRMGKTEDLFEKIRDVKGIFHAKMGTIKDRNSIHLSEAEDIKKRWQEYTEEICKKDLNDLDNYDGVITHLEPDIQECEVKPMNKARGDGIPADLPQILRDDVKVLHSKCQQIWKTQQWPQVWKR